MQQLMRRQLQLQQQQQQPGSSKPLHQQQRQKQPVVRRRCVCRAARGRPRKTAADGGAASPEPAAAAAASPEPKRRGRKPGAESPTPASEEAQQQTPKPAAKKKEKQQQQAQQQQEQHDRVISYEMDITSSMELDYTDNAALLVPSYTHQAQGHESATQPALDNFVPAFDGASGFVGSEEPPRRKQQQQQQQQQQSGSSRDVFGRVLQQQQPVQAFQQQQQPSALALQVMQQPQLMSPGTPEATAAEGGLGSGAQEAEDDDEDLLEVEEPPGLFDYEAGLAYAITQPLPERPLTHFPAGVRPRTRREADYLIRYFNWIGTMERHRKEEEYKEQALAFHLAARVESENVYLTGKAMSVVTAEIEAEDAEFGNRVDTFYPIWARAEHRWYPTGRFAAYNEYVKANLPDLTMKFAPGADQEIDFDIMDDVLLMADDPAAAMPGASGAGGNEEEGPHPLGPAAGLSLDGFMGPGLLPGAAASELGQAYIDDVLAATGDEELSLEEE